MRFACLLFLMAHVPATAQDFDPPTWSADMSYGTSIMTLGTREYRWASTFGVELSWPARIAKIPSWERVRIEEFAGARVMFTDIYGQQGESFDAGWISLGFRLTYSDGDDYTPYVELGSGIFYANEETLDLSTKFNFASFAGVGMYIHSIKGSPRIGLRFIHISNAGTGGANGGVNLLQGTIGVKL